MKHIRGIAGTNVMVRACDVGRGVFATRPFRCGERILVFRGDRYDRDDLYIGSADEANFLQTGPFSYILPNPPGLYVNHSCNPNAGIVAHRRLIALRDIAPDEEIRFDYSTTMDEDSWTMDCMCGEPGCRRVISDFKYLSAEIRLRYADLGVVPRFILRKLERENTGKAVPGELRIPTVSGE